MLRDFNLSFYRDGSVQEDIAPLLARAARFLSGEGEAPKPPQSMMERIARNIAVKRGEDPDMLVYCGATLQAGRHHYAPGGPPVPLWLVYVPDAYSALEVMREPSEEMVRATRSINPCQSRDGQCYSEAEIYRAMIDAALAEKVEP